MGDKIELLAIEIIQDSTLYQSDLLNTSTGQHLRMFVSYEELHEKLFSAPRS
jgi:hypothetical protein